MNPLMTTSIATARIQDLQRAAGCCTMVSQHRAAARQTARRTGRALPWHHAVSPAPVCCA